jgi:hypothetical protein
MFQWSIEEDLQRYQFRSGGDPDATEHGCVWL